MKNSAKNVKIIEKIFFISKSIAIFATTKYENTMKTFAELKAFCEKNNVRYEVNAKRSDKWYNPYSGQFEDCILGWYFGMNNIAGKSGKSEYQWTWFYCYAAEKPTDESKFFFEERYSQLNGKSYKSVREEIQAEDCIERRMN